jgi:hypothetical protein
LEIKANVKIRYEKCNTASSTSPSTLVQKRGIKMGQNILDDKKQKLPYFEEQKIYLSLKSTCR